MTSITNMTNTTGFHQWGVYRALGAEWVKLKRSPILITAVLLPFVMAFVVNIASSLSPTFRPLNLDVWDYTMQGMITFWAILLVFIVPLITALIAALEHTNHTWKHLFALAIPRRSIYTANVIAALALFGISMIVVLAATILSGLLLRVLKPELGFDAPIPLDSMLLMTIVSFLGQWLIVALHTWAGTRFANFGPAIAFGLVAFLINTVILPRSDIWPKIFPWTLPSNFFNSGSALVSGQVINWDQAAISVALSVVGCIVVTVIASHDITSRDVA